MNVKTAFLLCCVAIVLFAVPLTLVLRDWEEEKLADMHVPAPFPMEAADKLSVEELVQRADGELVLPSWMPGEIRLREVYFKGLAILVYSDHDTKDYRQDNVTVQISKIAFSPASEEPKHSSQGAVKAGDFWVVVYEDAAPDPWMKERGIRPILAEFLHNGFSYLITGIRGQITREEMLQIVASMKPLGPETLRKA